MATDLSAIAAMVQPASTGAGKTPTKHYVSFSHEEWSEVVGAFQYTQAIAYKNILLAIARGQLELRAKKA